MDNTSNLDIVAQYKTQIVTVAAKSLPTLPANQSNFRRWPVSNASDRNDMAFLLNQSSGLAEEINIKEDLTMFGQAFLTHL